MLNCEHRVAGNLYSVILCWISPLRLFVCARTIYEYNVTMPVPCVRVMSQIELWRPHNTKIENTVLGEMSNWWLFYSRFVCSIKALNSMEQINNAWVIVIFSLAKIIAKSPHWWQKKPSHSNSDIIILITNLKGGYTGFTLSVCPSVDIIVSALYLQQYSWDPYHNLHISSSNFRRCVALNVCYKIQKFE